MRSTNVAAFALPILLGSCTSEDLELRVAENRVVTQQFMQTLKGALQAAIKEGGPVNAVAVCNEKAPLIAEELSATKGRRVGRTSLRIRNPSNHPDEWERNVLQAFDKRRAKGEDPKAIEHHEMLKQDDQWVFRYMKAIPTAEVCLACHGSEIDNEVAARLKELYPEDQATGYKAGELRGAFTITQPM